MLVGTKYTWTLFGFSFSSTGFGISLMLGGWLWNMRTRNTRWRSRDRLNRLCNISRCIRFCQQILPNILSCATMQGAPSYGGGRTCGGLKSGFPTLQWSLQLAYKTFSLTISYRLTNLTISFGGKPQQYCCMLPTLPPIPHSQMGRVVQNSGGQQSALHSLWQYTGVLKVRKSFTRPRFSSPKGFTGKGPAK